MVMSERMHDDYRLLGDLGDECKCRPDKSREEGRPIVVQSQVSANLALDKTTKWLLIGLLVVGVLKR
jgi:hypothetical protein